MNQSPHIVPASSFQCPFGIQSCVLPAVVNIQAFFTPPIPADGLLRKWQHAVHKTHCLLLPARHPASPDILS